KAPPPLDPEEPEKIAESVQELGLKHVVITMVARDDLPDGGAEHLRQIVESVRARNPEATLELLISDLEGNEEALKCLLSSKPDIFNHNVETVRRLTPRVRHKATYDRTLFMLRRAKELAPEMFVKSGLMVGLGEEVHEVEETIRDLHSAGCQIITIGQYLQASRHKLRVKEFVHPDRFDSYAHYGRSIGVAHLYSGPFVRSSYNAGLVFQQINQK
ncbi:MAG: lipoyl synthase, partial [Chlamydiia bacterium]|nr:lipoyl synthase [Chlamydiia bacterium]